MIKESGLQQAMPCIRGRGLPSSGFTGLESPERSVKMRVRWPLLVYWGNLGHAAATPRSEGFKAEIPFPRRAYCWAPIKQQWAW